MKSPHIPVLANEVLTLFEPVKDGVFVDCTLGFGGHAKLILERFNNIEYIGIDRDENAIEFSTKQLAKFGDRFRAIQGAFSTVLPTLKTKPIAAALADLGVSSLQLDSADRGFGFASSLLDMRMDTNAPFSAENVVNHYDLEELIRIFRDYGEEPQAKRMAEMIVKNRPFDSNQSLATLIERSFGRGKIHAATRIFQAIRIEVNDELGELENMLSAIETMELSGAIVGIISFHSLEDRIVKNRFRNWSKSCICPKESPRCLCGNNHALGQTLTKKPILPQACEAKENPRSRSAKLRGFKFYEH
ncbi:ribosomal RNA small subunit methyltransferase H [Campylobacterota bacterium]|nr:ribosomal RNA small subunit methyltransferase H [Campylobacterota bacterium]